MTNEKIAEYIDKLIVFVKQQEELRSVLYEYNIDIINYENEAVNLLFNMICEVSGISKEHLDYYIYELDYTKNHCYYQDGKPIIFKNTIEFLEWIKI